MGLPRAVAVVGLVVVALLAVGAVELAGGVNLLTLLAWAVLLVPVWPCVLLLVDRVELRVDERGLAVVGRRHTVAYTWEQVAAVGIGSWNAHRWLTLWPVERVAKPRQRWMYPAWLEKERCVLLGRVDMWRASERELRETVTRHAPDRWVEEPPVGSADRR